MEEYGTIGTVGRSAGTQKIPLLIASSRSYGGGGILDGNIVRITIDKKDVYVHPCYHQPVLTVKTPSGVYPVSFPVFADGEHIATFQTREKAERWIKFMKGESNRK